MEEIVPKTMWIGLLEREQKDEIKRKLYDGLRKLGQYDEIEIDFIIEDAMDSRICDLADVIDIYNLELTQIK